MNEETPLEVLTPSALESIERASIDVQVATAHRFPRSLAIFKKRAMDMVQQDFETAESCIYVRPVGKGDDGKQKYAEGASIRMAEIVAACYGNIRFGARIIEQTERYVKAEGVAHDLESNTAGKSEAMESTVKRNGQPYDERMRIVVAKAALSKALRDSIFRVVPRALCKSVYDAAKSVIAGQQKTLDQRRKAVQSWLATIKVDDARTFAALGVKGWAEVGEDQLLTLTGLKTGIKDNELTITEAFPPAEAAKAADLSDLAPTKPAGAPANVVPISSPSPTNGKAGPATGVGEAVAGAIQAAHVPPGSPAIVCKYCQQPVENLEGHSCPEMQAAIAATQQQPEQTPQSRHKAAMTKLDELMKADGVTLEAVSAFTLANILRKKEQRVSDLSAAKIENLCASWETIKPELLRLTEAKP